jgi:hypothetical protein
LVGYERYSAQLFPDPNNVMQAARIVANQRLTNLTVQVKGMSPGIAKPFGDSDEEPPEIKNARSDCESENWLQRLRDAGRKYLNWFDRDVAADGFAFDAGVPIRRVQIYVMDTPIPPKMPNLDRSFVWKWPQSFRCRWLYDKENHHGSHLASIIGSLSNGTGFLTSSTMLRTRKRRPLAN